MAIRWPPQRSSAQPEMHQPGARPGDLPAGPDPDLYDKLATETGPDRRREQAFDAAWRFLAHRDRTEAEIRGRLERNDVETELIDEVLEVLLEGRYVDDAAFARRFAEDRRNLDGWGGERIERRLIELGVDREHIRAALSDHDELGAACELLANRFPVPPDSPRDLERALGFLIRKGYELELAHDALRRHAAGG